ncbi:unnamed protein product, partial [Brenthis ino]
MERIIILILPLVLYIAQCQGENDEDTILSAVLTPDKNLIRQERSYYERYGRPYDRLEDRPSRCGRCDDDDDDDDYDRGRDRDDDKRSNRPTYGGRRDKNKNYDDDERRYDNDRNKGNKNGTDDDSDDKKRPYDDDKDRDRHSSRKKHRNRYDDRDRYRPDYYDRFLRDPYRDRYDRDRYDDPYSRRPYSRYPDRYDDYGRYDGYAYTGYRRPSYDDRYDRGTGYDDSFGGYGPRVDRGPHDSFRPWDETYRGQSGWDTSGRGYYFASGRPDASAWGQREYSRPASGGWQDVGYSGYSNGYAGYNTNPGYNNAGYRASSGYGYQDINAGYGQSSGWRNVGERRPYRDQSGVANLDRKPQAQDNRYGQSQHGQIITYQPGTYSYTQSSTTPASSYLFQREDEIVTQETTLPPS